MLKRRLFIVATVVAGVFTLPGFAACNNAESGAEAQKEDTMHREILAPPPAAPVKTAADSGKKAADSLDAAKPATKK